MSSSRKSSDSLRSESTAKSHDENLGQSPVELFDKDGGPDEECSNGITKMKSRGSSLLEKIRTINEYLSPEAQFNPVSTENANVPSLGGGRQIPNAPPNREMYEVSFDGPDDPMHPQNWPIGRKIFISATVTSFSFCNSLGSALLSTSSEAIQERFHVGQEVATLVTSLYVLGFACGPIAWGPLSELFGRKFTFLPASFGYVCFAFSVATAENIQTLSICRFFTGFFGGSTLVLSAATMSDIFEQKVRGRAMVLFGLSICCGPTLAPIIGGFTEKNSSLGWRFNAYWNAFIGSAVLIMLVFMKETYHPVVLANKAREIRRLTGNWAVYAPHEKITLSLSEIVLRYLARPLYMLFTEPVLFLISLYAAFIYGLIYLLLTEVPLIYGENYHFEPGVADLPYIAIFLGCVVGGLTLFLFDIRYKRLSNIHGRLSPRERLPAMMVASICVTVGLFWMSWTGDYPQKIHWIVPAIGGGIIGLGFLTVIQPCVNYVVDAYLKYAASGLAAMTVLRSIFGGVFPLFAHAMFTGLKIRYAGTILGAFSALLIPVPFLFFKYDKQIRARSKLAVQ